ncbi:MAG: FtsQ-type POTRA domain-containing protein [Clostridia bacterium]|nr:FtsQ-type POTRA domain-containing protein [Clostridia bacterium]
MMQEGMRQEDKVRRALEGLRARLLMRFGEKNSKRTMGACIAGAVILIMLIVAFFAIRIDAIEVTGDVTMFNEGDIIRASGIREGDGLFWRASWTVKNNVEQNVPMTHNVRVTKSLFGKVTIYVELKPALYYCEYGGRFFAIDEQLRVLDESPSYKKYTSYGAVKVILPEIREPRVGESIVFYYTVEETDTEGETIYEVESESKYAYVKKFLAALIDTGYRSEANGVIVSEKFDVTFIYQDKYKVRMGDVSDLDIKFRLFYEMIAEGSMQYADKVSIDVSNISAATARPDPSLDFSDFAD